jgi:hypothetical protein
MLCLSDDYAVFCYVNSNIVTSVPFAITKARKLFFILLDRFVLGSYIGIADIGEEPVIKVTGAAMAPWLC